LLVRLRALFLDSLGSVVFLKSLFVLYSFSDMVSGYDPVELLLNIQINPSYEICRAFG
jgi:hypothetical protein